MMDLGEVLQQHQDKMNAVYRAFLRHLQDEHGLDVTNVDDTEAITKYGRLIQASDSAEEVRG